jgi:hypothetical protein
MGDNDGEAIDLRRTWFGIDVLSDVCMTALLAGRWRLIWHNPRYPENWRVDWIFNEDVRQVGVGPVEVVYIRSDDF